MIRAPFPWYGGKSLAAATIWRAFGDVPNYVEPFAGSLAVLLARPGGPGKVETANDLDGLIANFWRATSSRPDEVARWADWPVNEADLHARHRWLVAQVPALLERLVTDPEYSDAKIAGWWVWGICSWIGNGWCHRDERFVAARPHLGNAAGRGVQTYHSLPKVGTPGHGIHAPSRKKPLTHRNKGVHRDGAGDLAELFGDLADRLRGVRVCCGDWTRVLGRSTLGIDTAHGMTPCGVLLDPPYHADLRHRRLYAADHVGDLSGDVRRWAIENGDNPALRIALCGFEAEHDMPASWRRVAWASTSTSKTRAQERIWFSPHCLPEVEHQASLALGVA
jgi:hypothetical protein